MKVIAGTKFRATENYEAKKEKWLAQVAADHSLTAGDVRTAFAISLHMNRKQRLLAWPGYSTIAKAMGGSRRMAIRGVKALEGASHLRVVRSRNGTKNKPNHYHPNVWASQTATVGVVTSVTPPSDKRDTSVVTSVSPEPLNEPMREPLIRGIGSQIHKIGRRESNGSNPDFIGQPKPLQEWSTPQIEEITGTAEANLLMQLYAAPPGLFRPVISRFDRNRN